MESTQSHQLTKNKVQDAPTKTAVIYLRVSSLGQVHKAHNPEGYSIPAQREACTRMAKSLGATVLREFIDSRPS